MKTFLQITLLVLLALVLLHCVPVIGLPAGIALSVIGAAFGLFVTCVGGLISGLLSVVGLVVAGGLVLAAVLSPLWVPLLVLVAVIALLRRPASSRAV